MAKFALLRFKINNTFQEREKTFYHAQNPAIKMGINSISHGHQSNDLQKIFVLMMIEESDNWSTFL